mmetsp:Transcript_15025/g.47813  ORF Transcript_15025/g.47813 Transcript_15025/m.47813 type:complete len:215 (-) Transcript_15025:324-968(-)
MRWRPRRCSSCWNGPNRARDPGCGGQRYGRVAHGARLLQAENRNTENVHAGGAPGRDRPHRPGRSGARCAPLSHQRRAQAQAEAAETRAPPGATGPNRCRSHPAASAKDQPRQHDARDRRQSRGRPFETGGVCQGPGAAAYRQPQRPKPSPQAHTCRAVGEVQGQTRDRRQDISANRGVSNPQSLAPSRTRFLESLQARRPRSQAGTDRLRGDR